MNKKSIIQYLVLAVLLTICGYFIIENMGYIGAGFLLVIPISIPTYAAFEFDSYLDVDFEIAYRSIFLAASLLLNLLIYLPVLLFPRFSSMKKFIITQSTILVVYIGINIPFFIVLCAWMSV